MQRVSRIQWSQENRLEFYSQKSVDGFNRGTAVSQRPSKIPPAPFTKGGNGCKAPLHTGGWGDFHRARASVP
jgi:hypothetical protein